jgi:pimeloyl-ACP methyl ester carboxylesterase
VEAPVRSVLRLALLAALLCGGLGLGVPDGSRAAAAAPGGGQPNATPGACHTGSFPTTGALWLICVPSSGWNGGLIVWAHGYVEPGSALSVGDVTLPDGTSLVTSVQLLGYAFATTSYRRNGLAVLEGVDDIRDVIQYFPTVAGSSPTRTYLIGASEGGLIATLLVERSPILVSGAVAMCGPVGDFQKQLDYIADFRVLFDYFFPGQIPPSPIDIPQDVIDNWDSTYVPTITVALQTNPISATALISTSLAPIDPADPNTVISTTQDVLWYNIFAANDARAQLGGNPFDNQDRDYGSSAVNAGVQRFSADAVARAAIAPYQTSGRVTVPLVLLHTTGDDVVPYWHETLYLDKVRRSGDRNVRLIAVNAYGHCKFGLSDVLNAFNTMRQQAISVRPQVWLPLVRRE